MTGAGEREQDERGARGRACREQQERRERQSEPAEHRGPSRRRPTSPAVTQDRNRGPGAERGVEVPGPPLAESERPDRELRIKDVERAERDEVRAQQHHGSEPPARCAARAPRRATPRTGSVASPVPAGGGPGTGTTSSGGRTTATAMATNHEPGASDPEEHACDGRSDEHAEALDPARDDVRGGQLVRAPRERR